MNKLKELLEKKRKAAAAEGGGNKLVNRAELEEYRLKQLRQQEEEEIAEKVSSELYTAPLRQTGFGPQTVFRLQQF